MDVLRLHKRKEGATMKKVLIKMIAIALFLLPLNVYAQSEQTSTRAPAISQALVPEGDFALQLVSALKLGTPNSEVQAEDMLTSVGIAPKNGWIAEYPVTPIIIGELQNSVATAADSRKLPMGRDEALKAFQDLTTEFGLPVAPGSGQYAESQPPTSSDYVQPPLINNYYYEEGPPVVTYYPPPWDYYYLYAWVPYPFWCSGFFFPGFFVLNDFDIIVAGHHHHRITNHFFDAGTHSVFRVDPMRHALTNVSHTTAFNSATTRKAASSIFNHSMERSTFTRGTQGITGNHISVPSGMQGKQGVVTDTDNGGKTMGSSTLSNSNNFATGSGMNHRSSQSFSRSFSAPSSGGSSSCANCHEGSGSFGHGSGHSFGGFSASHSSGGFSGGHAPGGFSGGGFSHGGGKVR
jgi:hypothetical protein